MKKHNWISILTYITITIAVAMVIVTRIDFHNTKVQGIIDMIFFPVCIALSLMLLISNIVDFKKLENSDDDEKQEERRTAILNIIKYAILTIIVLILCFI